MSFFAYYIGLSTGGGTGGGGGGTSGSSGGGSGGGTINIDTFNLPVSIGVSSVAPPGDNGILYEIPIVQGTAPLFPLPNDYVIRVGQSISMVWNSIDLTNVNVVFYKGDKRLLVTNKVTKDGQNKHSIFVDNSYFSADFLPCRVRIEMKENPSVYSESPTFKVLRQQG